MTEAGLISHYPKEESQRPNDSQFIQQTLPTIHPIMNTTRILPILFIISMIFIPLGIGIWIFAQNVGEIIVEYTFCQSFEYPNLTCADVLKKKEDCTCLVDFKIPDDKLNQGSVYMYYYLTNHYYQNHKDYVKSKDESQLKGEIGKPGNPKIPDKKCGNTVSESFRKDSSDKPVLPCGALANYMFSDSIELYNNDETSSGIYTEGESNKVPLIRNGIAIKSDRKFKNPEGFTDEEIKRDFLKPPSWKKSLWDFDPANRSNNGLENEDFIIWMKVAAFPNFRKLYRVVNTTEMPFENGLHKGNYTLKIEYNYKVTDYDGTKSIIFTTNSMIGAQNHFLGIAYLVVGGICLGVSIIFLIIHMQTQKKLKNCYDFCKND